MDGMDGYRLVDPLRWKPSQWIYQTILNYSGSTDLVAAMSMHMWMWFGYELGEFLFPGLEITSRWAFALTWIALFFVALLFEGSKVYLAKVQRAAIKRLYPYRSDERRNLLCEREAGGIMEPTTSRNANNGPATRWASLRVRALVNTHQSFVFLIHNVVGYLLMLAVMVYNVHLLLAVVFGMMLGYFLFGTKLTRLQMQCFSTKRVVICTPECDDTDRCNREKCSWEECEGKLCKEMNAMELQIQQEETPLSSEPYKYDSKTSEQMPSEPNPYERLNLPNLPRDSYRHRDSPAP
ncbi:unnamed protein product [Arctia plantaginis]|uniref:Copper transport protein n=1 Tax=Arctia plantaginis TaxID=874455 RepID=A0A8S1B9D5_ARCPL|nr:unnamed protein product [Arctia plantaginis]